MWLLLVALVLDLIVQATSHRINCKSWTPALLPKTFRSFVSPIPPHSWEGNSAYQRVQQFKASWMNQNAATRCPKTADSLSPPSKYTACRWPPVSRFTGDMTVRFCHSENHLQPEVEETSSQLRCQKSQAEQSQNLNHKVLGSEMELFAFPSPRIGSTSGCGPVILPKGNVVIAALQTALRKLQKQQGFDEVYSYIINETTGTYLNLSSLGLTTADTHTATGRGGWVCLLERCDLHMCPVIMQVRTGSLAQQNLWNKSGHSAHFLPNMFSLCDHIHYHKIGDCTSSSHQFRHSAQNSTGDSVWQDKGLATVKGSKDDVISQTSYLLKPMSCPLHLALVFGRQVRLLRIFASADNKSHQSKTCTQEEFTRGQYVFCNCL